MIRTLLFAMTAVALCFCSSKTEQNNDASLGSISFTPNGSAEAQPHFEKGLLLLHSFEFDDARTNFIKAREVDPDFVMAYWGEAMSHNYPLWSQQQTEKGIDVLMALGADEKARTVRAQSELEKDFVRAVCVLYESAEDKLDRDVKYYEFMRGMHEKYPDNVEVAAFYALSMLGSSPERAPEVYEKSAKIAQSILEENPAHPGALHYLIHSYDDPGHAHLALGAANEYSQVAPDAGHALHMPSHIYVALGMWDEVVSSNIASWNANEKRKERLDLDNDALNYHALQWLMYGHLQKGENEEARKLLGDMLTYHNTLSSKRARAYVTMMRAGYLADVPNYDDPVATFEVQDSDLNVTLRATNFFTRGMTAYVANDAQAMRTIIDEMSELSDSEEKRLMQRGAAMCSGVSWASQLPTRTDVDNARVMELQLEGLHATLLGDQASAGRWLSQSVVLEDKTSFLFGPPTVTKPAHELYAQWLLERGSLSKAQEHIELALVKTPGRRQLLLMQEEVASKQASI